MGFIFVLTVACFALDGRQWTEENVGTRSGGESNKDKYTVREYPCVHKELRKQDNSM